MINSPFFPSTLFSSSLVWTDLIGFVGLFISVETETTAKMNIELIRGHCRDSVVNMSMHKHKASQLKLLERHFKNAIDVLSKKTVNYQHKSGKILLVMPRGHRNSYLLVFASRRFTRVLTQIDVQRYNSLISFVTEIYFHSAASVIMVPSL